MAAEWWDELLRRWYPGDPFKPIPAVRAYYEAKHAVAVRLRPKRIVELGVRAGYSAFAFLSAVPEASYVGVDDGSCDLPEHNEGRTRSYLQHAERVVLQGFSATIVRGTTQREGRATALAGLGKDALLHVDANHTTAGCLHDLELAELLCAEWILVDDFDCPGDDAGAAHVRTACRTFLLARPGWAAEYLPNALVGSLLLARR